MMDTWEIVEQLVDICDEIAKRCIVEELGVKELDKEADLERARIVEILLNHFCKSILNSKCHVSADVAVNLKPNAKMTEMIIRESFRAVTSHTTSMSLRALTRQAKPIIILFLDRYTS